MKKLINLLTVLGMTLIVLCCSKNEETVVNPVNDSLAGNEWMIQEGTITSIFSFLDDKNMKVTESSNSSPSSVKMTRAQTSVTYDGTYTYNSGTGSATFNYNNRTRHLTEISIGNGKVSCKIDGVNATFTETFSDKLFLDGTAQEFVGMFNESQAANYASIYNVIRDSRDGEAGDKIDDIIDGLTTKTSSPNLTIYKYAIKAALFKGNYVLRNGSWYMESSNGHTASFYDDKGRLCTLTVSLSGVTKNLIVYEEHDTWWNYYDNSEREYIYQADVPSHIECVLTQDGSQLVKVVCDLDLTSVADGGRINLSRNPLSFSCTADLRDVAKITTAARYQAQGTSTVDIIVEKNNKKILTANASTTSKLTTEAPEDWIDGDESKITDTYLNLDILGKVKIKGTCNNISSVVDALDDADDYNNRFNRDAVKRYVDQANSLLDAKVYYNNDESTVRATLKFDVDSKEGNYYDYYSGTSQRFKYVPTSSICFPDGTSYFMESYFSEDAFKTLFDMVRDLKDGVENQFK